MRSGNGTQATVSIGNKYMSANFTVCYDNPFCQINLSFIWVNKFFPNNSGFSDPK
jgi:hypothetical protein